MNNEKLMEILQKLLKRLDLVSIAVMAILLGIVAYVVLISEGGFSVPPPEPPAVNKLVDQVAAQPFLAKLNSGYPDTVTPLAEVPQLRILIQNDLFSLKAVKAVEEARQALGEEYKKAEAFFVAQKLGEAEAIIDAILAKDASHPEARDLKKKITEAKAPKPTPTPAP